MPEIERIFSKEGNKNCYSNFVCWLQRRDAVISACNDNPGTPCSHSNWQKGKGPEDLARKRFVPPH